MLRTQLLHLVKAILRFLHLLMLNKLLMMKMMMTMMRIVVVKDILYWASLFSQPWTRTFRPRQHILKSVGGLLFIL